MKKWLCSLAVITLLPIGAFAQQTITIEQERIRGELDFPQMTVIGKRQAASFPLSTMDLKAKDVLPRVPKALLKPQPVERTPLTSKDPKHRESVAK